MHVPLVEQELFTVPEHLGSPLVFSVVRVTRSLVSCVYFVYRCLSFCTFSFGHCIVCSSSNTDYDYPFGISKLFIQMYNYILLIPVIINSLNCSEIVVNIDTSPVSVKDKLLNNYSLMFCFALCIPYKIALSIKFISMI